MWSFIVSKALSVCYPMGPGSWTHTAVEIHWRADSVRGIYLIDVLLEVGVTSFLFQFVSPPVHDNWLRLKDIIALYLISLNSEPVGIRLEIMTNLLDDPVHNIDAMMLIKAIPISINVSMELSFEDEPLTFFHLRG